ncbi:methyltransferase-like 26 [Venturia canescens]|uniref:methyltransferase-like 26 n=1 Tax=Venturia canescens TaxID=32260 RepID=UPI001C9CE3B0|nr:methyltransferase-like 26 [Venturia canescens]XP_043287792.1 methyltransferase-like 26 [Venturia canescens]
MNIIHCAASHRSGAMAAKKLIYPAADRNKDPILSVLKRFIRPGANQALLEIASGSGQHVAHFAPHFPQVTFFPSECEDRLLESISAHTSGLSNVRPPSLIDSSTDYYNWPSIKFQENSLDYIYCANMIHISPYRCTIGLFKNAGALLKNNGFLFTYGAYAIDGKLSPESNVRFDESLKSQSPEWGIRDLRELEALANSNHINLVEVVDMPANNKTVIWQKNYQ